MATNLVFIDTSFFKALVHQKDEFHTEAVKLWEKIRMEESKLSTSNFIFDETMTLVRKRCGFEVARDLRLIIIDFAPAIKFYRISSGDEAEAWNWFLNDWSDLSFTDCTSFALMKRLKISRVATFDEHFSRAGFKVVK